MASDQPSTGSADSRTQQKTILAIDLFCGLGGWTEGLLAEGWTVVGFDNEQHIYGEARYPAQLVLQDVLTLHGSQFVGADLIVASPPCQAYSYRAMPWKKAKALPPPDNMLFEAPFRIQREACDAAGRFIPLVVENVCGAQKWVGRARWHYGSFYLWGDVPALMPLNFMCRMKSAISCSPRLFSERIASTAEEAHTLHYRLPNGVKSFTPHGEPLGKNRLGRKHGGRSKARKAASAHIAKIPYDLARWIGRAWHPRTLSEVGA